jgi:hypothetical protein
MSLLLLLAGPATRELELLKLRLLGRLLYNILRNSCGEDNFNFGIS